MNKKIVKTLMVLLCCGVLVSLCYSAVAPMTSSADGSTGLPDSMKKLYVIMKFHVEPGWITDLAAETYVSCTYDWEWPILYPPELQEQETLKKTVLAVADVLESHNAKGSFCCYSFVPELYPELLSELVVRGHEVGTHAHIPWVDWGVETSRQAVLERKAAIDAVIGPENNRGFVSGPGPVLPFELETGQIIVSAIDSIFEFSYDCFGPWREFVGGEMKETLPYRPTLTFPFDEVDPMDPEAPLANQIHVPECCPPVSFVWYSKVDLAIERAQLYADFAETSNRPVVYQRVNHPFELQFENGTICQPNLDALDSILTYIDGLVKKGKAQYVTATEAGEIFKLWEAENLPNGIAAKIQGLAASCFFKNPENCKRTATNTLNAVQKMIDHEAYSAAIKKLNDLKEKFDDDGEKDWTETEQKVIVTSINQLILWLDS